LENKLNKLIKVEFDFLKIPTPVGLIVGKFGTEGEIAG